MSHQFYLSDEYVKLLKIRDRLEVINTSHNRDIYVRQVAVCKEVCKEKFDNCGYVKEGGYYSWEMFDNDKIGPDMIDYGDYQTGGSYMPDWKLYMAVDGSKIVMTKGREILVYDKKEVELLRDKSICQMQKIHKVKYIFKGEIERDKARDKISKKDKRLSKYV